MDDNIDIGSNVFGDSRPIQDEDFIPPTTQTLAEMLCGFPGLSGPGGYVLGSAPSNLGNFLFPKYNDQGVPFSILKYWGSGSRMGNNKRIYTRQFRPDENPKISFKMRVDPWGYFLWGGHPMTVQEDFPFVRPKVRPKSRKVYKQEEFETEVGVGVVVEETPEFIFTLANKHRNEIDRYDQLGEYIYSDLSLTMLVGTPAVAVCTVSITELEFCQTLPDISEGELIERRILHREEQGANVGGITWESFTEYFTETKDSRESGIRDDVYGIEFTIPNSIINKIENTVEINFMLNVGGQMVTLPEALYVGKDKTVLKDQESVDVQEVDGPLSWVPQTTTYPLVEGTQPMDLDRNIRAHEPHKIDHWDMSVKKGGRY